MLTKKELIKKFVFGGFSDMAVYNPSAFESVVIVELNDWSEYVFGYTQYMNEEKKFFKVKFYWSEHDQRFSVQGRTYYVSEFLTNSFIKNIG